MARVGRPDPVAAVKGMKGWGPSITPHSVDGGELISTSELRQVFPAINRVQFGRIMDRAKVEPDPHVKGARGERFWPQRPAIAALSKWESRQKGMGA